MGQTQRNNMASTASPIIAEGAAKPAAPFAKFPETPSSTVGRLPLLASSSTPSPCVESDFTVALGVGSSVVDSSSGLDFSQGKALIATRR